MTTNHSRVTTCQRAIGGRSTRKMIRLCCRRKWRREGGKQKIKLVKKTRGWRKPRRRRWSSSALRFEGWWKRTLTEPPLTGATAATICNSFPDYSLRLTVHQFYSLSLSLSLVSVIRSVCFRRTQKPTYITKYFNRPSSLPWTGGINQRTGAAQALPTGW